MPRRRKGRNQRLYSRVTVIVGNPVGDILLVKHNRQNSWALPGGQRYAGEDPAHRAALEVAEETGLQITNVQPAGFYAGKVASHTIYMAEADGTPRPNHSELQDAVWWDGRDLQLQPHVNAIIAVARNEAGLTGPSGSSSKAIARTE